MPVQITARRDGFRRLGMAHSASTVTYPNGRFTPEELSILKAEPNLIVTEIKDVADAQTSSSELSAARGRIAELEAGVLTLNQDIKDLKTQLDTSQAQLESVTAERDRLLAEQASTAPSEEVSAESEKSEKKKG
ncbi:HI1506-related protein [Kluyvera georgiana]|uniref:HI1506-related protein n=1 Tax=Kluyvera georgiana TaxID=73098 RepID=UPI003AEF289B